MQRINWVFVERNYISTVRCRAHPETMHLHHFAPHHMILLVDFGDFVQSRDCRGEIPHLKDAMKTVQLRGLTKQKGRRSKVASMS